MCCFLILKYNKNDLKIFFGYAKSFELILANIERKSITGHMRMLVIDFLYLIIFLKSQFKNDPDVLERIAFKSDATESSLSNNFNKLDNKIYALMLAGHSKIAHEIKSKEYTMFIRTFLNKVYFVPLSEPINGFNCMSSVIFIKYPIESGTNFSNFPSEAFAFLTIVHELGHYNLRIGLQLKSDWFNFETPKNVRSRGPKKSLKDTLNLL